MKKWMNVLQVLPLEPPNHFPDCLLIVLAVSSSICLVTDAGPYEITDPTFLSAPIITDPIHFSQPLPTLAETSQLPAVSIGMLCPIDPS